jgi:antitoxin component YwqK of YwqJK toxin-antitoxin module
MVEEYTNGKRNGLVQEFSEDGKLVRQAQYRDDRQVAEK